MQAADYLPSGIATTEYNGLTADNYLHMVKARAGDKIEKYKVELNEATAMDLENIIRRILDYGEKDGYFLEF